MECRFTLKRICDMIITVITFAYYFLFRHYLIQSHKAWVIFIFNFEQVYYKIFTSERSAFYFFVSVDFTMLQDFQEIPRNLKSSSSSGKVAICKALIHWNWAQPAKFTSKFKGDHNYKTQLFKAIKKGNFNRYFLISLHLNRNERLL